MIGTRYNGREVKACTVPQTVGVTGYAVAIFVCSSEIERLHHKQKIAGSNQSNTFLNVFRLPESLTVNIRLMPNVITSDGRLREARLTTPRRCFVSNNFNEEKEKINDTARL